MIRLLVGVFIVILSLFFSVRANACSCARGDFWISEFLSSEEVIVFQGFAISTRKTAESLELENALLGPLSLEYMREVSRDFHRRGVFSDNWVTEFSAERTYKGDVAGIINIEHTTQGTACGIRPVLQKTVMIIAFKSKTGTYKSSSCALHRAPELAVKTHFETGQDVFLPDRNACYKDIRAAYEVSPDRAVMKLENSACSVYRNAIVSQLNRAKN